MADFDDDDVARLRAVFSRMSRAFSREAQIDGLTRTRRSVLVSIVKYGPVSLSELAEIEGLNPTMLSRVIGKLDEDGLIRRSTDNQDRRIVRVEISPAGRQLHDQVRAERAELLRTALAQLHPEQVGTLFNALDSLESLVAHAQPRKAARGPASRQLA